jgi:membrane-bound serine protease (ClpP class)
VYPAQGAQSEEHPQSVEKQAIWLLQIDGAIGPAVSDYLSRGIDRAHQYDAQLIVLEMDTPGGLDTSMRDIIQRILASKVPIVTYVYPAGARAASAGTYILYASHLAAMAPATNLGAATPVQIGMPSMPKGNPGSEDTEEQEQTESAMELKMVNDAVAFIRGLAELRGRNADWAESAVREAASLTASVALEKNVIDIVATDTDELVALLDGKVVMIDDQSITLQTEGKAIQKELPDWRTRFLEVITNPNLVLILGMIGFYGIILEFYNPGFGVPGVVGAICLLLAGYALQMLPVNYAGVAFIILGIGLIAAEAMVPSFGIFGFGGIVSFTIGAIILIDTDVGAFRIGVPIILATGIISLGFVFVTINLAMKMRHKPTVSGVDAMRGMHGIAMSDFKEGGQVRVQGELWNAVSDHPIMKDDIVQVTQVNGLQLTVEKEGDTNA